MQENTEKSPISLGWQVLVCVWMMAAQIWYYAQFKEQFGAIFVMVLRRLWH